MHNFDRGIIKWLPFDALSGYKEAICKLKEKRNLIDKPLLSPDQEEELDFFLKEKTEKRADLTVYYYEKGKIFYLNGKIEKVDFIYKKIKIGGYWLKADSVIGLTD